MLFYDDKKIKDQITADYKELEKYKNSYSKRISLYNLYLDTMQAFEDGIIEENKLNKEKIEDKIKLYQVQIDKINSTLELASNLQNSNNIDKKIKEYSQMIEEIKNDCITNLVYEDQITENFIFGLMIDLAKTLEKMKEEHKKEMEKVLIEKSNTQYIEEKEAIQEEKAVNGVEEVNKEAKIKSNNTLLISDKLGKVVLPYRAEEILEILKNENNKYNSADEVIKDKFTRNLTDYKIQFASRYTETMKLARERENYSFLDSVVLATEMMKKRFLHPAIITACRSLNELDVYLDCLDKNELEDFKIFKVEYELYPMAVKQNNVKRGKRYKNKVEVMI